VKAGIISPLEGASREVGNLTQRAQALLDAGFGPNSEVVQDIVEDLEEAEKEASKLREQMQGTKTVDLAVTPVSEIQKQFNVGEGKAREFKQQAQRQIGQVISAAGQLGAALARAFSKGEKGARDIASILLQSIGGFLSAIPGVGTITGPALSAIGGVLGAFSEGGQVTGPGGPTSDKILALLSDKEFVMNAQTAQAAPGLMKALNEDPSVARSLQNSFGRPQALSAGGHVGNAVGTNGSMPSGASGVTVNIDTEVRRLRGRELGLVIRENEQRKAQFS